jgi:hypothetical protein
VKAGGILEDIENFDAHFFGFTPREAQMTDPQHRVFLECCWEALEHAGYSTDKYPGLIGLYGGAGANTYLLYHLASAGYLRDSDLVFRCIQLQQKRSLNWPRVLQAEPERPECDCADCLLNFIGRGQHGLSEFAQL